MSNENLNKALAAKNDEFHTQTADIESELIYYADHLRGKSVFCNCDDYKTSNFYKYFKRNFGALGLSSLCAVGYREGGHGVFAKLRAQDERLIEETGLLFGDGDFKSYESLEILRRSDVVITNPPFSLFRDYLAQLVEHKKQFLIIGSIHAVTYKQVFPLIKDGEIWLGRNYGGMEFNNPDGTRKKPVNTCWFTNIGSQKGRAHLALTEIYSEEKHPRYDNFNAINVDRIKDIPLDYCGVMGVPITFLEKHNPSQFEVVGITTSWCENLGLRINNRTDHCGTVMGENKYQRILIKRVKQ